ncbi:OmpA family protein [Acinetobacter sp.]|uniref:OmpA family protein n=1 Tax=Acinetobacter sp. TaxID=472 RepID=UPI0031D5816A
MSINPIELLKEKVTPFIVDHQQLEIDEDKKSSLLAQFYPILLAIFHKFPDRLDTSANSNDGLVQLFAGQSDTLNQLLKGFATHHSLPENTIASLFNQAIPLSAQVLKYEAGDSNISTYLDQYTGEIARYFPAWAAGLLSALGLAGIFGKQPESQQVYSKEKPKEGGAFGKLLPWIFLIILAALLLFFWKSCQHKKEDMTTVGTASGTQSSDAAISTASSVAGLALTSGVGNQIQACHGNVGNSTLASLIQTALTKVFGTHAKCNVTTDQAYATTLPAQDKIEDILNVVKAVPNASIDWQGDKITVNASNADAINALVSKIKAIVPQLNVIAAAPLNAEQSVKNSIDQSKSVLSGLGTSARPEDIARALNIQIINFASNSAKIPQQNKDVLDQAVALIKQTPNVVLTVEGYTDSTGHAAHNKTLSQQRAQAVVDYFVSKGVDAGKFKAVGFGAENPVADNVTDQGKFRNRRIEFKVTNTESGKTAIVDEDHAQASTVQKTS